MLEKRSFEVKYASLQTSNFQGASSCVRSTGKDYLASMMRMFNETKMAALALVLMQTNQEGGQCNHPHPRWRSL